MKKNKKKKKSEYDIPNSQNVKKLLWIFEGISFFVVLLLLLGAFVPGVSVFLWYYFLVPFNTLMFFIGEYASITIFDTTIDSFYVFFGIIFFIILLECLVTFHKKIPKGFKHLFVNQLRSIYFSICFCLILSVVIGVVFSLNHPTFSHLYFPEQEQEEYTLEDFDALSDYLSSKVLNYSDTFDRDENGKILYDGSLEELAVSNLRNISNRYPFLRGYYPRKLYSFSKKEMMEDPSTLGLTFITTVKINDTNTTTDTLNTITHELCHTKGITRENEANFCSFIAGVESDNSLSQYAAYLEAYGRFLHAYKEIYPTKALEYEDKVLSRCLIDEYRELCNFYLNDIYTSQYIKKSNRFLIRTYLLNHYSYAEIENFVYSLKSENVHVKVYMRGEKVLLQNLKTVFDQNQDQNLIITFDNSEEIFKRLQPFLYRNKDRYISIVQDYPGIYTGVHMEPEEAIEYYTKPIPSSNLFTSFGSKFSNAYDYSRTVRLLLEYYH